MKYTKHFSFQAARQKTVARVQQITRSSWNVARLENICYFERNMLFLIKLNPEFSSQLLEDAKATLASSLFLLAKSRLLSCRFDTTT